MSIDPTNISPLVTSSTEFLDRLNAFAADPSGVLEFESDSSMLMPQRLVGLSIQPQPGDHAVLERLVEGILEEENDTGRLRIVNDTEVWLLSATMGRPSRLFELAHEFSDQAEVRILEVSNPDILESTLDMIDALEFEQIEYPDLESPPRWHLRQINAPAAWNELTGAPGEGIFIGHPDSGYREHPSLGFGATPRVDFERSQDHIAPEAPFPNTHACDHGLGTGSVILGDQAHGLGVAWGATLFSHRVTDKEAWFHIHEAILWEPDIARLADAIYACVDDGCSVISISLGFPFSDGKLELALRHAHESDVIICAASSNYFPFVIYPAASRYTIACAGSRRDRNPWCGSGRWTLGGRAPVDISAPGHAVPHAVIRDREPRVSNFWGTSFATACTAGAAAMWLQHRGEELRRYQGQIALAEVFRWMLRDTASDFAGGRDHRGLYGAGILDIQALLRAELPTLQQLEEDPLWNELLGAPILGMDHTLPSRAIEQRLVRAELPFVRWDDLVRHPNFAQGQLETSELLSQELLYLLERRSLLELRHNYNELHRAGPGLAFDDRVGRFRQCLVQEQRFSLSSSLKSLLQQE